MALIKNQLKLFTADPDRPPETIMTDTTRVVAFAFYDARNSKGILAAAQKIASIRNS
jgi:hypothetical protein